MTRDFNPGSAWVEPKLYRFDGVPGTWEITVLRPWPDPRAWRLSSQSTRWVGCRPLIDLSIPDRPLKKNASRRRRLEHEALRRVPAEIRRPVGRYVQGFQWGVLSLVARVDGALELLETNPALAVGLAYSPALRKPVKRPLRSARWLVRQPRRRIAGWLGLPATKATVRTLARVEPEDCNLYVLRQLGELLESADRWVHHLPKLRTEVIQLMEPTVRHAVTYELLEEMTLEPRPSRRAEAAWSVRLVLAAAERLKPARKLPPLRSIAQVSRLVEELLEEERRQHLLRWRAAGPFPEPPYPGQWMPRVLSEDRPVRVEPVADAEALLTHAEQHRNCLANDEQYLERILDGTGYAFELSWDAAEGEGRNTSATLFVEGKGAERPHWTVHDLKLRCNDEAPAWLDAQVARFLARVPAARDPSPKAVVAGELLDERQLSFPFAEPWAGIPEEAEWFL